MLLVRAATKEDAPALLVLQSWAPRASTSSNYHAIFRTSAPRSFLHSLARSRAPCPH